MRKAKVVWKITANVVIMMAILTFTGCGTNNRPASQTTISDEQRIIYSPTGDPRVIIGGFQQEFIPAGVPLTEEQQKRIMEVAIPKSRDLDLRPIFGVLTREQKRVIMTMYREALADSEHPLTESQEARIMAFGPGSEDKSYNDIITPEQIQTVLRKQIERQRSQTPDN